MSGKPNIDFGLRSDDYARHRPGFPASFFDRLQRIFSINAAQALDLGTGPGTVALDLACRGAIVIGLDVSPQQIQAARRNAQEQGLTDRATFATGRAEQTHLPAASFDLVTAGQCWVWFDHQTALAEVQRVLRPGRHLVVAHNCYLAGRSPIAARSEELIYKYNPGWTMGGSDGLYPAYIDSLQTDSMKLIEQFCYDYDQPFTHESWRGRMRTCNGVGAGGMSEQDVTRYDADLARFLEREHPSEPLAVEHRVWAVVCRRG